MGVNPFMNDLNFMLQLFGVARTLPLGGADACIAVDQIQCMQCIPCFDPSLSIKTAGKFWIKAKIRVRRAVIPFAQVNQTGIGKHIPGV